LSSMAANTGVVSSASVTAQMEATIGFSFTFEKLPGGHDSQEPRFRLSSRRRQYRLLG
jgi:hypothetical protein